MTAPLAPAPLPPGRLVPVDGRGEFFVRDSGPGGGPTVLLLHGWMFGADTNFFGLYAPLAAAGFRVVALDHRGHGRGLRTSAPFRLTDCADDAAAVVRALGTGPVIACGYSLGGPVAQLMARDHRDTVAAIVLCATASDWHDWWMRGLWRSMAVLRLWLGLVPLRGWHWLLAAGGVRRGPAREWLASELSRGSSVALAEAGRELSRYDARPWLHRLRDVPGAVVVTTRDTGVLPGKQRRLARAIGAPAFPVRGDHGVVVAHPERFARGLLAALAAVAPARAS